VEKDVAYEELRDKVQAMVGNKIATTMGPAPMDVGEVNWQPAAGEAAGEDGGEWGVDAVWPSTQCHQCGGYGHLARDCPTKGPGKGGKGAEKGGFKGFVKGGFKGVEKGAGKGGGGKGTWKGGGGKGGPGKGYQGTCWKCGRVGHKAAECQVAGAGAVEAEVQEEVVEGAVEVEMGGVWVIGSVHADEVETSNKFNVLAEEFEVDMPEAPEEWKVHGAEARKRREAFGGLRMRRRHGA